MTDAVDLTTEQRKTLNDLLHRFLPSVAVWAYGSRVKWTARPNSDLDLVAFTTPPQRAQVADLKDALAESNLPFPVDLHVWDEVPERFREIICKDYVVVHEAKPSESKASELNEWREVSVDEIKAPSENALATGPFGSSIGSRFFKATGIPVIRGSNLSEDIGTRLIDEGLVFLTPDKAQEFSRSTVREGDLVFTCWGTVNQIGLIDGRATYRKYVISNKQMKLTPDPAKADSLFLYYLFSSSDLQDRIKNEAIGSSVPGFNLGQLRAMRLVIPEPDEQRAIAHILGTLDDKIELNRRMNKTLEDMARTLFKSWFVDFDPVRAKAEGCDTGLPKHIANLFLDSFEDSELGEMPRGWAVGQFGDVVDHLRDQENPLLSPDVLFHHFSIPAFDEGQTPKLEYGESIKSLKSRVPAGVVLLSKLNPEIERVWLVDVGSADRAVCSTEFLVLKPRPPFTRSFVYCLMRSPFFRQQIEGLVTGTSKSHQRAQVESILNLPVVVPPSSIVAAFDRTSESLLARTLEYRRESHTLAALRDTLLPKLTSGELRVKDAERFIERGCEPTARHHNSDMA